MRLRLAWLFVGCFAMGVCQGQRTLNDAAEIRTWYEDGLRANGIVGSSLALVREGRWFFATIMACRRLIRGLR